MKNEKKKRGPYDFQTSSFPCCVITCRRCLRFCGSGSLGRARTADESGKDAGYQHFSAEELNGLALSESESSSIKGDVFR